MQGFTAEESSWEGTKKRNPEKTSWGMKVFEGDLMTVWHVNTKLNTLPLRENVPLLRARVRVCAKISTKTLFIEWYITTRQLTPKPPSKNGIHARV